MVRHVVMWIFKSEAEGKNKAENIKYVKSELEKLPPIIDSIETLEVGLNFTDNAAAYDVILISTHQSKEILDQYRKHPDHIKIAGYISKVTEKRVVIDNFSA
ncbi:Dabb family protein [Bacteroidota bacterium]